MGACRFDCSGFRAVVCKDEYKVSVFQLVMLLVKITSSIISYLHDKKLMDAGAAQEALSSLEKANAAVQLARDIRTKTGNNLDAHPERMHDDDATGPRACAVRRVDPTMPLRNLANAMT